MESRIRASKLAILILGLGLALTGCASNSLEQASKTDTTRHDSWGCWEEAYTPERNLGDLNNPFRHYTNQ